MTTTRSDVKRSGAQADAAGDVGTLREIVIERVEPELDGGRHPVKRVVGDRLRISADILAAGHGLLEAVIRLAPASGGEWREEPLRLIDNDRWSGSIELNQIGRQRYTIQAWPDAIGTWAASVAQRLAAGMSIENELPEGRSLVQAALQRADGLDALLLGSALAAASPSAAAGIEHLTADSVVAAARRHPDRDAATSYRELALVVDRERARFSAWYELFPRSQGRDSAHPVPTTLRDAEWRLPGIAAMGFDVVYLPPIHPIGRVNRKGRNNAEAAAEGDPGSPWAIGSSDGGHTAVAAELGGTSAFDHFRQTVEQLGMEVAVDLAIQTSPDHPWVTAHPEWYRHDADGSIRYAENPPKRYQDIYPIDFGVVDPDARAALWQAWLEVVLTWVERGVRIFRVDNPHTKPIPFWSWLIETVQRGHPDVIFLSEAFTRPKMMRALAKVGFSQSYSYFTWRESAAELREYLTELTTTEMREYYRGNFFTNTPDINPHHLEHGRPAFVIRSVLAATLSSAWGIYSGWELCENARLDDREEYLHSEKYEIRARDWDAPGNIKELITALNRLRRDHRALQLYDNLQFEAADDERTLFYRKALPDGELDPLTGFPHRWRDAVFVAVNTDPTTAQRSVLRPDLPAIGIGWDEPYLITDLVSGVAQENRGREIVIGLDPAGVPFRIFSLSPRDS